MNRDPASALTISVVISFLLFLVLYANSPDRFDVAYKLDVGTVADHLNDSLHLNVSASDHLSYNATHASNLTLNASQSSSIDKDDISGTRYEDVLNSTIGFQQIFVISLPTRADRLDAFTVQAGVNGMSFAVENGIDGKTVLDKALPMGMSSEALGFGAVGCWRAHLNVFQKMVQHNIQSALIFEDDADWDIAIKHQMLDLARGTRFILNSTDPSPNSPYGDDWDVLWIGHGSSEEQALPRDPLRWVTPLDPTVIPPGARHEFMKPNMSYWDDVHVQGDLYTRVLYKPRWGSQTTAYAISLRGALKMMFHQSMLPFRDPIDNGMGNMCWYPESHSNFTCIAPFPRLVAPAVPPGAGDKMSDIRENDGIHDQAESNFLMYSARLHIDSQLRGEKSFAAKYGGEVGPTEMPFENITRIRGHGERLVQDKTGTWYAERVDK